MGHQDLLDVLLRHLVQQVVDDALLGVHGLLVQRLCDLLHHLHSSQAAWPERACPTCGPPWCERAVQDSGHPAGAACAGSLTDFALGVIMSMYGTVMAA